MRKYQQLLLLIISFVCVITLLFYRHEYLKLRSVLNVLNFFGNVDAGNNSCLVFSSDLKKDITQRYRFAEPRSTWTKLEDHYVYSSCWQDTAEGGFARTILIGPQSLFSNYQCRIWFEVGDTILSETGIFKFAIDLQSRSDNSNKTSFKYFFKCLVPKKPDLSIPYGVLWITPSNSSSNIFSPVFYKRKKSAYEPVVCVLPDYTGLSKTQIIEFISFYNTVGVNHFIVYDSGVQHSIFPFLESVAGGNSKIKSISVLQWNFPLFNPQIERYSLKDDCLSRTYGVADLVGIISWNEYIFPNKFNLNELISANRITDVTDLSFSSFLCCVDHEDEKSSKSSWPMFLRKTRCKEISNEEKLFINLKSYGYVKKRKIQDVPKEDAILRRYDSCDQLPLKLLNETAVPKFYTQVMSHSLLKLWKSHLKTSTIFS